MGRQHDSGGQQAEASADARELLALIAACQDKAQDDEAPDAAALHGATATEAEVIDLRGGSVPDLLGRALTYMVDVGASDLHLKAGSRPWVRVEGMLRPAPFPELTGAACSTVVLDALPAHLREEVELCGEADFALSLPGVGRFRLNAFRERGYFALGVRTVPNEVADASTLGLLPAVQRLADLRAGLVIFAGKVGAGKSTTMAWAVDRINATRTANIVSVEDPIEYVHADKRAIVHQREIGADTGSYGEALRRVLRQDPDVLVIGEIRDEETARTALHAAQTGHLVLTTLHTDTAPDAVDRLLGFFPIVHEQQARRALAAALRAVVCQRLVTRRTDRHRVLAQEVLIVNGRVVERIVDPHAPGPSIAELVEEDEYLGMVSFDQHLVALHRAGRLTRSDILAAATNSHDLALYLDRVAPPVPADTAD